MMNGFALSRRRFLRVLFAGGAGLFTACVRRAPSPTAQATRLPIFTPSPSPTLLPTASPTRSIPTPTSTVTPALSDLIQQVVIFIQENHTFDSLFADFPGTDGKSAGRPCPDALPSDPPHQHRDSLTPNGATSATARCSYSEADAPNYWQLAREFSLCDRFFSDVRGPSHPNYLMLMAGQSPIVNTPWPSDVCPDFCLDLPTLPDRLDARGLTWRDYAGLFTDIKGLVGRPEIANDDAGFFSDAAAGKLPNVAWLNSGFLADGDARSGHPPASLCAAENYAVKVFNALMSGPQWKTTAAFLIWDDWGGFYDHVEPPVVEKGSDGAPVRYGFRVPCIVAGPYARQGYVSHQTHSFVSILRFIETVFNLAPLTVRDAQASDMLDCLNLGQSPRPPIRLDLRDCPH